MTNCFKFKTKLNYTFFLQVAPPQGQGASSVAAASAGSSRARSVSEAPDGLWEYVQHQQQNPQFYRYMQNQKNLPLSNSQI